MTESWSWGDDGGSMTKGSVSFRYLVLEIILGRRSILESLGARGGRAFVSPQFLSII